MRGLRIGDYVRIIKDSVNHRHPIGGVYRLSKKIGGGFWCTDYHSTLVPPQDIKLALEFKDYYNEI